MGNLYITDLYNAIVRKIDTNGIITTIAGTPLSYGYTGDGGSATLAKFNQPVGVTVDKAGNVYVSDNASMVVRKIDTTGIINTIAGNDTAGYNGDGGLATLAELKLPSSIYVDTIGNLYIADQYNNRIRKVSNATYGIKEYNNVSIAIWPIPCNNMLNIGAGTEPISVVLYDILGNEALVTKEKEINTSTLPDGVYFINIKTDRGSSTQKIVVQH